MGRHTYKHRAGEESQKKRIRNRPPPKKPVEKAQPEESPRSPIEATEDFEDGDSDEEKRNRYLPRTQSDLEECGFDHRRCKAGEGREAFKKAPTGRNGFNAEGNGGDSGRVYRGEEAMEWEEGDGWKAGAGYSDGEEEDEEDEEEGEVDEEEEGEEDEEYVPQPRGLKKLEKGEVKDGDVYFW